MTSGNGGIREERTHRLPLLREGLIVLALAATTLFGFFHWYRLHGEGGENLSKETYSELYDKIRGIGDLCSALEEHGINRAIIVPWSPTGSDEDDLAGARLLAEHVAADCRRELEVRIEEGRSDYGDGPLENGNALIVEDNLNDRYYDRGEYEAYLDVEVRYRTRPESTWRGVIPLMKP